VPKAYSPESGRKVLDLVAAGRLVAQVAHDLEISAQTVYTWPKQQLIDSGRLPGTTSTDHAELVAARKRIAELRNELAIHRRDAGLPGDVVPPRAATRRSQWSPSLGRRPGWPRACWGCRSRATTSGGAGHHRRGWSGTPG
jgi:transposase